MRMLRMEVVQKDILADVERTLRAEFMSNLARTNRRDNHEVMAEIFNFFDRVDRGPVHAALEERNKEAADRIKALMFTFEDLAKLDAAGIQTLLRGAGNDRISHRPQGRQREAARAVLRQHVGARRQDPARRHGRAWARCACATSRRRSSSGQHGQGAGGRPARSSWPTARTTSWSTEPCRTAPVRYAARRRRTRSAAARLGRPPGKACGPVRYRPSSCARGRHCRDAAAGGAAPSRPSCRRGRWRLALPQADAEAEGRVRAACRRLERRQAAARAADRRGLAASQAAGRPAGPAPAPVAILRRRSPGRCVAMALAALAAGGRRGDVREAVARLEGVPWLELRPAAASCRPAAVLRPAAAEAARIEAEIRRDRMRSARPPGDARRSGRWPALAVVAPAPARHRWSRWPSADAGCRATVWRRGRTAGRSASCRGVDRPRDRDAAPRHRRADHALKTLSHERSST